MLAPRQLKPRPHNKEAPEQQAAAAIGVREELPRAMLRCTLAALRRRTFSHHREEASQVPAGKAGLGGAAVGEEEGVECVCLRAQTSEIMILPNQQ
ncbi:hypothetical protein GE21DRAFT_1311373 [Neurospora crassa]|nr:hypothetical protein GE21DRAFT_1311373 [Neurospora crassa]